VSPRNYDPDSSVPAMQKKHGPGKSSAIEDGSRAVRVSEPHHPVELPSHHNTFKAAFQEMAPAMAAAVFLGKENDSSFIASCRDVTPCSFPHDAKHFAEDTP
jgi:hypothetical protein